MAMGNWQDLSSTEREALLAGSTVLLDQFFEDVAMLERGAAFSDTTMIDYLPRPFMRHYTPAFARSFLITTSVVAWKLAQDEFYMLACVAEEIALHAIIEYAESLLEIFSQDGDYDAFIDETYEDTDFLMLFEARLDGIQGSAAGRELGVGHLEFNEWFLEFGKGSRGRIHPYGAHQSSPAWMKSGDD